MNYWVVGAMWGSDDQFDVFIRRGYWMLGWSNDDQPVQAERRDQIKPGDRIGIKRMLGKGATEIEIRALGVVTEIDPEDKKIYVDWLVKNLHRRIPSHGCFSSIHGPFQSKDEWIKDTFYV